MTKETQIEEALIGKLSDLKYTYRSRFSTKSRRILFEVVSRTLNRFNFAISSYNASNGGVSNVPFGTFETPFTKFTTF